MLKPLGQNYLKSSLGQPIQRKPLGRSLASLGTPQLPPIPDLKERERMRDFSYLARGEWNRGSEESASIPSIQARQDNLISTSQSKEEDIVVNNTDSEDITSEVQRSPLNSSSLSTPRSINENTVSDRNSISEMTTPEVQRSPLEPSSPSTDRTPYENTISNTDTIAERETSEVQRSLEDTPHSELPGYQDVYSENNVQSRPTFSLSKLASNTIDNTLPIAKKVIQRVNEIASSQSSSVASSESVQAQAESSGVKNPEIQQSPSENSPRSTPQTTKENIVSEPIDTPKIATPEIQQSPSTSTPQTTTVHLMSDRPDTTEIATPEVQRSSLDNSQLSIPEAPEVDIVSDSTNITEIDTPEVQRSPEEKPLSELPGYQDTYSENKPQSRSKFSLSKLASNAVKNTFPIARKVIQRFDRTSSQKPSNSVSPEVVQPKEESVKPDNLKVQRSPALSTPQVPDENLVSNSSKITENPTPEVQRSPIESTPQITNENLVSNPRNIAENPTSEVQRSPLESPSLSTPQITNENLVSNPGNIAETSTSEIQRSPLESPSLSTPQITDENLVSNSSNIAENPTSEIQRSPSLYTPQVPDENLVDNGSNIVENSTSEIQRLPSEITSSPQSNMAIATEESRVTTLSEGRGFLQLQPLGQPQPLGGSSDYNPSSFVSTSLKEILNYSGENSASLIQKKDNQKNTVQTSVSASETLDFPQSWSNVSELIGDSPNTIDAKKTEDWGGFSGLMGDTSLLPESPPNPDSEAIVQAKSAPVEGELMMPIAFEEIAPEEPLTLPPTPQQPEPEQPIADEELDWLAQLVYRLVRSRLNIDRERQYNQIGGASFWPDTVYFARAENNSLASSEMLAMLEALSPYSSDRLSILAREVYVLLQMRMECDRDRHGICN
ncbi:MAG: hypothetical protein AAGA60_03700 [Cyanobacteria bacterium P01_E01_bin.42]